MKAIYAIILSCVALLCYSNAHAQQINTQFYSHFTFPNGLFAHTIVQTNDYAIWMAGENFLSEKAFILRCDPNGIIKWYAELEGADENNEISSMVPASDGSCIFTFFGGDAICKIGYGKIDTNGAVNWFKSVNSPNLNWTSSPQVSAFGKDFIIASTRRNNLGVETTLNLFRIDEDGILLASAAFNCTSAKVGKILLDSQKNILICGDFYHQWTTKAFLARTDSNFQAVSLHIYSGGVEFVHDAIINSSDEIILSGVREDEQTGSWSGALMKVNTNGQLLWSKHFASPDWMVSEFFGIEKGTDSATYFAIFEPEYFHGYSQTTGILRFTEDGIADTLFYRNDSTFFFTMLERGKDNSYLQAFIDPNSTNGVVWKSNSLITDLQIAGSPSCFSGPKYYYPLISTSVNSTTWTCYPDSLLALSTDSLHLQFSLPTQDVNCNFHWETDNVPTTTEQTNLKPELIIIPNPCSDICNIYSENKIMEVRLTDITGRQVLLQTNTHHIDVRHLPPGLYITHIRFSDNRYSIIKIQVETSTSP